MGEPNNLQTELVQKEKLPEIAQKTNPLIQPVYPERKDNHYRITEIQFIKMKETSIYPTINCNEIVGF